MTEETDKLQDVWRQVYAQVFAASANTRLDALNNLDRQLHEVALGRLQKTWGRLHDEKEALFGQCHAIAVAAADAAVLHLERHVRAKT